MLAKPNQAFKNSHTRLWSVAAIGLIRITTAQDKSKKSQSVVRRERERERERERVPESLEKGFSFLLASTTSVICTQESGAGLQYTVWASSPEI